VRPQVYGRLVGGITNYYVFPWLWPLYKRLISQGSTFIPH